MVRKQARGQFTHECDAKSKLQGLCASKPLVAAALMLMLPLVNIEDTFPHTTLLVQNEGRDGQAPQGERCEKTKDIEREDGGAALIVYVGSDFGDNSGLGVCRRWNGAIRGWLGASKFAYRLGRCKGLKKYDHEGQPSGIRWQDERVCPYPVHVRAG